MGTLKTDRDSSPNQDNSPKRVQTSGYVNTLSEFNEDEISKFGKIYSLKNSLQDKFKKVKEFKDLYSQREKDLLCRKEHLVTTKHRNHQGSFTKGMAVNRVFLNAINGGAMDVN